VNSSRVPRLLTLPVSVDDVRELHVGDDVLFSGRVLTARQAGHAYLARALDPRLAALLAGRFLYHCAPIVAQDPETHAWRVVADVIQRYGVRGVVGKGGMGPATLAALRAHGAVYLHAVGGLATALARRVTRVNGVHLLDELGVSEALWDLEVSEFPAIVTMDAHGESLHATLEGEDAAARALLERKSV